MKTVVEPEHAETHAREDALIPLFSEWVQQGTENFFAAQRILLDLVMRQNAMAINALRERLGTTSSGSTVLTGVAGEGFTNFFAAQKILLDLAKEQNEIVMTGVKERVGVASPVGAMTDLLRRSVETFINLQEHFLDAAAKQTKTWVDSAKTGKPLSAKGLGDFAREELANFVKTQKEFLDVIAEETAKATKEVKGTAKPAPKTDLDELARHSVDAFVEAQKRLLDTAGRQIELNIKGAKKSVDVLTTRGETTLTELTRQGVENFVAAQKALLDVMVKPAKGSAKEHARSAANKARSN
jgi:phage FluMu protein gp41